MRQRMYPRKQSCPPRQAKKRLRKNALERKEQKKAEKRSPPGSTHEKTISGSVENERRIRDKAVCLPGSSLAGRALRCRGAHLLPVRRSTHAHKHTHTHDD